MDLEINLQTKKIIELHLKLIRSFILSEGCRGGARVSSMNSLDFG